MKPTIHLLVGLPASGKTTLAREIATDGMALRLSPDEWMIPLFGESDAGGKRDVLEGRLVSLALEAVSVGTSAVLDFGFWGRDERTAVRWLARRAGARSEVHYLPIDEQVQAERIEGRFTERARETFPITREELNRWREIFQTPDADELTGSRLDAVPVGWVTWADWAVERWPSLQLP